MNEALGCWLLTTSLFQFGEFIILARTARIACRDVAPVNELVFHCFVFFLQRPTHSPCFTPCSGGAPAPRQRQKNHQWPGVVLPLLRLSRLVILFLRFVVIFFIFCFLPP
ncbi:hypothetical protein BKA57DRAFT_255566 [Linnemannia elongata]|nr:hypothetical protein BKA57DRAFT_255566 [Linnemannia elongata]